MCDRTEGIQLILLTYNRLEVGIACTELYDHKQMATSHLGHTVTNRHRIRDRV